MFPGFANYGENDAGVLVCQWSGTANSFTHQENSFSTQYPGRCENLDCKHHLEESAQKAAMQELMW